MVDQRSEHVLIFKQNQESFSLFMPGIHQERDQNILATKHEKVKLLNPTAHAAN